MNLSEKGRYAPPPRLPAASQKVSQTVGGWDGIQARTHWQLGDERVVDGADFYWEEQEVGHIHMDGQAHVVHSKKIARALVERGLAKPFPWGDGFVVFDIIDARTARHALWLFELSVDRCRGVSAAELLARVESAP